MHPVTSLIVNMKSSTPALINLIFACSLSAFIYCFTFCTKAFQMESNISIPLWHSKGMNQWTPTIDLKKDYINLKSKCGLWFQHRTRSLRRQHYQFFTTYIWRWFICMTMLTIIFWSFGNFASMKDVRRKYNPMIDSSKFTYNEEILWSCRQTLSLFFTSK